MSHTEPAVTFSTLGLSPTTLGALERAGFEAPTPIQARCIPPALQGKDVIGCAATGTGKTAAFLLPILERLGERRGQTRALVLAPTRELALQIGEELVRFGSERRVRGWTVIGGVGMNPQIDAFARGTEVIIATPGRLNDHLDQRTATLSHVEMLVLDEADRMLDMGFKPQLDRILGKLPPKRQTMLFSATMAGEVEGFARRHLREPVKVEVERSGTTARRAEQRIYHVAQSEKVALLLALLDEVGGSCLVFTRTKSRADRTQRALERAGHAVAALHANKSQSQRKRALDAFKSGEVRVLVATDIAARGIDVAEIGHVVNFDLPNVPADYVHRIGRTARASASGLASSFCSEDELDYLRDIERLLRAKVPVVPVPRTSPAFVVETSQARAAPAPAPARGGSPGRGAPGRAQGASQSRGGGGAARSGGQGSARGGGQRSGQTSARSGGQGSAHGGGQGSARGGARKGSVGRPRSR